jgi:hypothetical protein
VSYLVQEALFWGHLAVITAGLLLGFFLPFGLVAALVVAHRLHVVYFGGCLCSQWQQAVGSLPRGVNFLQQAAARCFRCQLDERRAVRLDYVLAAFPLSVAALRAVV